MPLVLGGMSDLASWGLQVDKDADTMATTHEAAKQQFLSVYGKDYGYNGWIDQHWWEEVGQRLGPNMHYLDMTGAGQYTNSQIRAVMEELTTSAFGNPHSRNPSSSRSTSEVEHARQLVLQFFNADPDKYYVIFTKGATEGLKMVGEYFPWAFAPPPHPSHPSCDLDSTTSTITRTISAASSMSTSSSGSLPHTPAGPPASHFIYTQANHKSVLGIGAYAKQHGAQLHCLTLEQMQQWVSSSGPSPPHSMGSSCCAKGAADAAGGCDAQGGGCCPVPAAAAAAWQPVPVVAAGGAGARGGGCCGAGVTHHLVGYPAKDNYEGRIYPLSWIEQVHAKSDASNKYLVLLDVAAHAASHVLDLSQVTPDFVTLSFYKIFGYPSGLGALLVHRDAARHLRKVYFGGGSVDYCTAEDAWAVLSGPPAGLEDGTLGFLNIAALKHGFDMLNRLGGMRAVEGHVEALRCWTYRQLQGLTHSTGAPLLTLFGAHEAGPTHQGGIFQFQVLTAAGDRLPGRLVEAAATAAGLHLRTGCNCNPGRCLPNLGITPEEERARAAEGHTGPVLVVLRPRPLPPGTSNTAAQDTAGGTAGGSSVNHQLVPVPLPVGSVRASLGALSTFEDCYALVRFLDTTFKDFTVNDNDLLMGVKMVSVFNPKEHQVTVRARISTSDGGAAAGLQGCALLGTSAPAGDGAEDVELASLSSEDSVLAEGNKAIVCSLW